MAISIITATDGKISRYLWLLSFREVDDEDTQITYRAYQSKTDGYLAFCSVVEQLESEYPKETWFADVEDAPAKTKFRTEALSTERIFAGLERVPFETAFSRLTKITEIK